LAIKKFCSSTGLKTGVFIFRFKFDVQLMRTIFGLHLVGEDVLNLAGELLGDDVDISLDLRK